MIAYATTAKDAQRGRQQPRRSRARFGVAPREVKSDFTSPPSRLPVPLPAYASDLPQMKHDGDNREPPIPWYTLMQSIISWKGKEEKTHTNYVRTQQSTHSLRMQRYTRNKRKKDRTNYTGTKGPSTDSSMALRRPHSESGAERSSHQIERSSLPPSPQQGKARHARRFREPSFCTQTHDYRSTCRTLGPNVLPCCG